MAPFITGRGKTMEKYGVLVVDHSALMRKTISSIIEASPNLYVIGKARNGLDAIEKVNRLKPAIVTLEIELSELDGLSTLKRLMDEAPLPVVMVSNRVEATLDASKFGAVDFVIKSNLLKQSDESHIDGFCKILLDAATTNLSIPLERIKSLEDEVKINKEVYRNKKAKIELLIIGSSTGGPSALQSILTRFPSTMNIPILIIQHMPPGFTKPLAERFNHLCSLNVKEAEDNELLVPGTIYIAPAGVQTSLMKQKDGKYMVNQKMTTIIEPLYKPSIDVTLLSISPHAKERLLTVILTGMGDDGLKGCTAVKKYGGTVLAQSEETCIVYGMPKVVYEAGLVDKQLPLSDIYEEIMIRV